MATRSSTTYRKRQKEMARQEKQRAKAAKRAQRKQDKRDHPTDGPLIEYDATTEPGEPEQSPEAEVDKEPS